MTVIMNIDDWQEANQGKTWLVKGMTLCVGDVVQLHRALSKTEEAAEHLAITSIRHNDVKSFANLGAGFTLGMASALANKALSLLAKAGMVRRRTVAVWRLP